MTVFVRVGVFVRNEYLRLWVLRDVQVEQMGSKHA